MPETIGRCPMCLGMLRVTRLRCSNCDTELSGSFTLSKLCSLEPEQLRFVEAFVKLEGKIEDVAKELGLSPLAVRSRLREAILALGYELSDEMPSADRRREILDSLAQKRISVEEAAELWRSVGGDRR